MTKLDDSLRRVCKTFAAGRHLDLDPFDASALVSVHVTMMGGDSGIRSSD